MPRFRPPEEHLEWSSTFVPARVARSGFVSASGEALTGPAAIEAVTVESTGPANAWMIVDEWVVAP